MSSKNDEQEVTYTTRERVIVITCDVCGREVILSKFTGNTDEWTQLSKGEYDAHQKHLCPTCTEKHIAPLFRPLILEAPEQ